jgi:ATP-dependent helicase HrpB
VAIDVEHRRENPTPIVRLAGGIEPEWLLDLYPDRIRDLTELTWNRQSERVEILSRMLYDSLPVAESRSGSADLEAAASLLADRALEAGVHRFADPDAVALLFARSEFAACHSDLRALTAEDVRDALAGLCYGLRSFSELEQVASHGLVPAIVQRLGTGAERTLNEIAPERIPLKGWQVKVHYPPGQQPYVAARLQDFFGMRETPKIARGRVPLLVHLLAPEPAAGTGDG